MFYLHSPLQDAGKSRKGKAKTKISTETLQKGHSLEVWQALL